MEVVYRGERETYHPRLGLLVPGRPFELPEGTAKRYIKIGLLERYVKPEPETKGKKEKKEVK